MSIYQLLLVCVSKVLSICVFTLGQISSDSVPEKDANIILLS